MEEQKTNNTNFIRYMQNPRAFTLKKWFYDMLKLNYSAHDNIIERVASSLATDKDVEDFGKLIGQVFEEGFRRALEQYKAEVEKLGMKITIEPPKQPS
jgi:hypothetical protein